MNIEKKLIWACKYFFNFVNNKSSLLQESKFCVASVMGWGHCKSSLVCTFSGWNEVVLRYMSYANQDRHPHEHLTWNPSNKGVDGAC